MNTESIIKVALQAAREQLIYTSARDVRYINSVTNSNLSHRELELARRVARSMELSIPEEIMLEIDKLASVETTVTDTINVIRGWAPQD